MTRKKRTGTGRGGPREGAPGQAYSNRTDLTQTPSAAPGQPYGAAASQLRAQAQAPLPRQAPPPAVGQGGAAPAPGPGPGSGGAPVSSNPAAPATPPPGGLGALTAPTARPGEPLTAGLPTGAGPGPESLGLNTQTAEDPTLATLKGILAKYPNADLQALVAQASATRP